MSASAAIVRGTQGVEWQRLMGICARRVVDMRNRCAMRTGVVGRRETVSFRSPEWRYDLLGGGLCAHRKSSIYSHLQSYARQYRKYAHVSGPHPDLSPDERHDASSARYDHAPPSYDRRRDDHKSLSIKALRKI